MKYTDSHEWVEINDKIGTVGVTDYAQDQLGDIVYVELPEVGASVEKGQEIVVLESTKAAADVYSPVSGTIVEVNELLSDEPELINQSPTEKGWLFKIEFTDAKEIETLMDEKAYKEMIG